MLGHSILYLISNGFNKLVPLLLLPVLTYYLNPSEYGELALFQLFLALFNVVFGLGLNVQLPRYFNLSKVEVSEYLTAFLFLVLFSHVAAFVLAGFLYFHYYEWDRAYLFWFLPLISFVNSIHIFGMTILRLEGMVARFLFFEIVGFFINICFVLFFLDILLMGWESRIYTILLSLILFSYFHIRYWVIKGYVFNFSGLSRLVDVLRLSFVFMPYTVCFLLVAFVDRYFIDLFVGKEALGEYAVVYQLGMIVSVFSDAFLKAWTPKIYSVLNDSSGYEFSYFKRVLLLYVSGFLIISTIVYCLCIYLAPIILDGSYLNGLSYLWLVISAYVIHGVALFFVPLLINKSLNAHLAVAAIISAAVNIIFNILFIPDYGAAGAAGVTVVSYAVFLCYVSFLTLYVYSRTPKGQ